jgi:quinol monooxygenase YgiN
MSVGTKDTPVAVVATMMAVPGQLDHVQRCLEIAVVESRTEVGCLRHDLRRVLRQAGAFAILAECASRAALKVHGESPAFEALFARSVSHCRVPRRSSTSKP